MRQCSTESEPKATFKKRKCRGIAEMLEVKYADRKPTGEMKLWEASSLSFDGTGWLSGFRILKCNDEPTLT